MLLRGARWRWHLRQSSIVFVTLACDFLSAHRQRTPAHADRQRTPTVFPITHSLNPNSLARSLPPSLPPTLSLAPSRSLSLARPLSLSLPALQTGLPAVSGECHQCHRPCRTDRVFFYTLNPNSKPVIHVAHSIVLPALSLGLRA
jgi:hypothetical protein